MLLKIRLLSLSRNSRLNLNTLVNTGPGWYSTVNYEMFKH